MIKLKLEYSNPTQNTQQHYLEIVMYRNLTKVYVTDSTRSFLYKRYFIGGYKGEGKHTDNMIERHHNNYEKFIMLTSDFLKEVGLQLHFNMNGGDSIYGVKNVLAFAHKLTQEHFKDLEFQRAYLRYTTFLDI